MTGNPFRQSQRRESGAPGTAAAPPDLTSRGGSPPHADGSTTEATVREDKAGTASPPTLSSFATKPKKSKSVRIQSPTALYGPDPAFPETQDSLANRVTYGHHRGSSPPSSDAAFQDELGDCTPVDSRREHEDDAHNSHNVERGMKAPSDMAAATQPSPHGVPFNPFSRRGGAEPAQVAGQKKDRTSKANLDVESFKRLLMTGISESPSPSQPLHNTATANAPDQIAPSAFESSSTDTSSVSRQSIFEHSLPEPHIETPRTSHEMARSDEETEGPVRETQQKKEKKKPPPAPKHRHGKLVTPRTPQTVSFTEFEATEFTPASPKPPRRTNSDLNKPLPPNPPVVSSPPTKITSQDTPPEPSLQPPSQDPASSSSQPSSSPSSSQQVPSPSAPVQKKTPPPVPLSRRQSQLRSSATSGGTRSRSSSILTTSSQHSTSELPALSLSIDEALAPISSTSSAQENMATSPRSSSQNLPPTSSPSSSAQKVPPPPPPARRQRNSLASAASSMLDFPTSSSPASSIRRVNISPPEPPTSRKSQNRSSSPNEHARLSRTPSSSSNHARLTSRSVSAESASMAPPPPPPPRRRQSGRSSLDKERPPSTIYSGAGGTGLPHSPSSSRRTSAEYTAKRASADFGSHASIHGGSYANRRTSVASESSLKYEYAPSGASEHGVGAGGTGMSEHPLYSPKEEVEEPTARSGDVASEEATGEQEEGKSRTSSRDILDEMERFQREIDELRERYSKGGVSG